MNQQPTTYDRRFSILNILTYNNVFAIKENTNQFNIAITDLVDHTSVRTIENPFSKQKVKVSDFLEAIFSKSIFWGLPIELQGTYLFKKYNFRFYPLLKEKEFKIYKNFNGLLIWFDASKGKSEFELLNNKIIKIMRSNPNIKIFVVADTSEEKDDQPIPTYEITSKLSLNENFKGIAFLPSFYMTKEEIEFFPHLIARAFYDPKCK